MAKIRRRGAPTFQRVHGRNCNFRQTEPAYESVTFRLFYQLYKLAHHMLTGVKVQVGNFSILPSRFLGTLVVTSELGTTMPPRSSDPACP